MVVCMVVSTRTHELLTTYPSAGCCWARLAQGQAVVVLDLVQPPLLPGSSVGRLRVGQRRMGVWQPRIESKATAV